MTSKLVVNTIEADTGISSVSFASSISMNSTSKFHFSAAGVDIGADTNINRPASGVLGFNINSSEKARIDSSGRLLIGTTTEGAADADDLTIASSSNTAGITIRTNTTGTGRLWFSDGTSGAAEYQGYIQYDHNNQILLLGSGGSTRLRILNNGKIFVGAYSSGDDFSDEGTFLNIRNNTYGGRIGFSNNTATAGVALMEQFAYWGNNKVAGTIITAGTDTTNKDDASMSFYTRNGGSVTERLRIDSSGKIITPLGTTTRIGVADRTSGTGAGGSLCVTAGAARGSGQTTGDLILASGRGNNSASGGTIRFGYNDGADGTNLDQEWLRIASNGRVNIGNRTTTPDELVHIHTASGEANVHVEAATNANLNLRSHSGDSTIKFSDASATNVGNINYDHATDSLSFRTNSNERARIDSSGRVLIGTTTEGFATYGDKFTIANSGHCGMTIRSGTSSDGNIYFSDGTSGVDEVRGFVEYKHSTNTLQLGANGATRLRITSSGHVTKPVQPSFAAYRNQSDWNVNGNYMVFNTTRHNIGGHYSTNNGRFTAPVDGSYYISFWSIYKNNYTNAAVKMYVNGSRIYGGDIHWTRDDLGSNWDHVSYSQVVYMNTNDYIQIYSASNVTWHGNHWQCYSGYLLG